ncbi:MAG: hypothetical protein U1D30_08215 [Planctomycetota bacterium]
MPTNRLLKSCRDAACEHAEALELLRVLNLSFQSTAFLFGSLATGDVSIWEMKTQGCPSSLLTSETLRSTR